MRKNLCWPHTDNEVYATVRHRRSYAQNCTHGKLQRQLKLFLSKGPLEYVATDILRTTPKTKQGNHFVFVMTDRYRKLTKSMPTTKHNNTTVARILFEHWVAKYVIPSMLLTDNSPQFVSKLFVTVCSTFAMNNNTLTDKPTMTQWPGRTFQLSLNITMATVRVGHQTDWDIHLLPLTYTYNVQVHRAMEVSLFSLVLTLIPPGPFTVAPIPAKLGTEEDMASPLYAPLKLFNRTTVIRQEAGKNLSLAQRRDLKHYGRRVRFEHIF